MLTRFVARVLGLSLATACASTNAPSSSSLVGPRKERPIAIDEVQRLLQVDIEKGDAGYIVEWNSCGDVPSTNALRGIDVREIAILDGKARAIAVVCSLKTEPAHLGPPIDRWIYGVPVKGMQMTACEPLRDERSYSVSVYNGLIGEVRSQLTRDGNVVSLGGLCEGPGG